MLNILNSAIAASSRVATAIADAIAAAWRYTSNHPVFPFLAFLVGLTSLYYGYFRVVERLNVRVSMADFVVGTTKIKLDLTFVNSGNRDAIVQSVEILGWGFNLHPTEEALLEGRKKYGDDPAGPYLGPRYLEYWCLLFGAERNTPLPATVKAGSLAVVELQFEYDRIIGNKEPPFIFTKQLIRDALTAAATGAEIIVIDSAGRRSISRVPIVYSGFTNTNNGKMTAQTLIREPRSFDVLEERVVLPDFTMLIERLRALQQLQ